MSRVERWKAAEEEAKTRSARNIKHGSDVTTIDVLHTELDELISGNREAHGYSRQYTVPSRLPLGGSHTLELVFMARFIYNQRNQIRTWLAGMLDVGPPSPQLNPSKLSKSLENVVVLCTNTDECQDAEVFSSKIASDIRAVLDAWNRYERLHCTLSEKADWPRKPLQRIAKKSRSGLVQPPTPCEYALLTTTITDGPTL